MPSKVAHSVAEHFDKQVEHGRIEAFLNAQLFCQVTATQFAAGVLINIIELAFQFGQFRLERFDCQSVFEGGSLCLSKAVSLLRHTHRIYSY